MWNGERKRDKCEEKNHYFLQVWHKFYIWTNINIPIVGEYRQYFSFAPKFDESPQKKKKKMKICLKIKILIQKFVNARDINKMWDVYLLSQFCFT